MKIVLAAALPAYAAAASGFHYDPNEQFGPANWAQVDVSMALLWCHLLLWKVGIVSTKIFLYFSFLTTSAVVRPSPESMFQLRLVMSSPTTHFR